MCGKGFQKFVLCGHCVNWQRQCTQRCKNYFEEWEWIAKRCCCSDECCDKVEKRIQSLVDVRKEILDRGIAQYGPNDTTPEALRLLAEARAYLAEQKSCRTLRYALPNHPQQKEHGYVNDGYDEEDTVDKYEYKSAEYRTGKPNTD